MLIAYLGLLLAVIGIVARVRLYKLQHLPPEPPKRSATDIKLTLTIYKNLPSGKNPSGLNTNDVLIKYYFPTKEHTSEVNSRLNTDLTSLLNSTYSIKPASTTWPNATFAQVEHLIGPVFSGVKNEYNLPFLEFTLLELPWIAGAQLEEEPDYGGVIISTSKPPHVILDKHRNRHVYIAGGTQRGKSTLILNMALQDMKRGKGMCILDPKPNASLALKCLEAVPASRKKDVIFLDMANPVPLDIMHCERELPRIADDIAHIFIQLTETGEKGEEWTPILNRVIFTLLTAGHCSFLDIKNILTNETRRAEILDRLKSMKKYDYLDYWNGEFKAFPPKAYAPILRRIDKYFIIEPVKTVLQTPDAPLNIPNVIQQNKILIVKLAGSGPVATNLIGTIVVAKVLQSAFAGDIKGQFMLYADEFQRFQTSDFATILSEAGETQLCLTLANQFDDQLPPKVFAAIDGNSPSYVCFTLGTSTAAQLRPKFGKEPTDQAMNLPAYKAVFRDTNGKMDEIGTPPPVRPTESWAEYIKERTFSRYQAKPRQDNDSDSQLGDNGKPDPKPSGGKKNPAFPRADAGKD